MGGSGGRSIVNRAFCYPSGGHRKDLSPGWSETEAPANTRAGRRSNWQGILYSLRGPLANSPTPNPLSPTPLANPVTLALCSASLICYIVTYSRQRGLAAVVGGGGVARRGCGEQSGGRSGGERWKKKKKTSVKGERRGEGRVPEGGAPHGADLKRPARRVTCCLDGGDSRKKRKKQTTKTAQKQQQQQQTLGSSEQLIVAQHRRAGV